MSKINEVINYAKSMIGVPYRWHRDGDKIMGDDKFWAENGNMITRNEIDSSDKCIVCTGLTNLMRRYMGLTIPGMDGSLNDVEGNIYPGTTGIWFEYLSRKGRLEKLDIKKKYPAGTMVLKNFVDIETDQGHVAVLIDNGVDSIMDQKIIHAYAEFNYKESHGIKNVGITGITDFKISHYYCSDDGYYTHVCLPENWILCD
jgi:hypothetical protein